MIHMLVGSDLGVPRTKDYLVCEWRQRSRRVVFSYAMMGRAITAHYACEKHSLRSLKQAINDMVNWLFWAYPWCEMIFGFINKESRERIAMKCGFHKLADVEEGVVYVRYR